MDNTEILNVVISIFVVGLFWAFLLLRLKAHKDKRDKELEEFRAQMDEKIERLNDKTFKSTMSVSGEVFGKYVNED